jgi:hypothetical protein
MLERERQVFREDPLSANSVGEDIMFAATRWARSQNAQVRDAGIQVLASMTRDALRGTPWNTVNWAVANLHQATGGKHDAFLELASATDQQIQGQQAFRNAVRAVKQNDRQVLGRLATRLSEPDSLSVDDPHYALVRSLWDAAASAEATLA